VRKERSDFSFSRTNFIWHLTNKAKRCFLFALFKFIEHGRRHERYAIRRESKRPSSIELWFYNWSSSLFSPLHCLVTKSRIFSFLFNSIPLLKFIRMLWDANLQSNWIYSLNSFLVILSFDIHFWKKKQCFHTCLKVSTNLKQSFLNCQFFNELPSMCQPLPL
jgi:hypothetical protein